MRDRILSVIRPPFLYGHHLYYEDDVLESGALEILENLPENAQSAVLSQAGNFFRVRAEMGLFFLLKVDKVLEVVPLEQLPAWTTTALDLYDFRGLLAAKEYIEQVGDQVGSASPWRTGLPLADVAPILENYARALIGRELKIARADAELCYTDTETIYLPDQLIIFADNDENFTLYKIMVTHQCAQIAHRTYQLDLNPLKTELIPTIQKRYGIEYDESTPPLDAFVSLFPNRKLALDIFSLVDTSRLETQICAEFEGMRRDLDRIKPRLEKRHPPRKVPSPQTLAFWLLQQWFLNGDVERLKNSTTGQAAMMAVDSMSIVSVWGATVEKSAAVTAAVYHILQQLDGPYQPVKPVAYQGLLRPLEAAVALMRRRESNKLKFQGLLKKLLGQLPEPKEIKVEIPPEHNSEGKKRMQQRGLDVRLIPDQLLIDDKVVIMPEAMRKVVHEILEDVGYIPSSYLMSGAEDMSGHHFRPLVRMHEESEESPQTSAQNVFIYDEWDYRRNGYRKNWCVMRETAVPNGDQEFVSRTLVERGVMVSKVRRQFEMLRLESRRLRRQQDGEDIDFDAAVEAFSDVRAGLNPSDKLLIRRQRNERSVTTAFLIDMSGSTRGWINRAIKEALVVMAEALEILGDRYAIYGFSGMTKKRCDLYRVKGFNEPYNDEIRSRVAGIEPQDYTRMGPPIRHATRLLAQEEARLRLLVNLSDGKPDDYDSYKGDYAVEDTRQALIEAKQRGVYPFCITIDKAAHSYISHMYGEVNYVFLDNVEGLPYRLAEIYRRLTT